MQRLLQAKSLAELAESSDFDRLINDGLVSSSPRIAVEKIESQFGEAPNRLGTNCLAIKNLREAIAKLADTWTIPVTNAMSLVAPHTHWPPAPIIHTYDEKTDRYWVGPNQGQGPYVATSFVFHPAGAIPYEWADASCAITLADFHAIWAFIDELNHEVCNNSWFSTPFPIGISINHRFKQIFAPATSSTHERPASNCNDALSYVVRASSSQDLHSVHEDQVGWAAASPPDLSQSDMDALSILHNMLSEMPESESSRILSSLTDL